MQKKNNDLVELMYSSELCEASKKASDRWLNDSKWKPNQYDKYIHFLDSLQEIKKDLCPEKSPHPLMKEGKYFI